VGVGVGVGVDVVVGVGVGVWVAAGAVPLGLPPSPPPPPQETSVPASRRTQTHRMQRFMPPSPSVLADSGAWRTRVRHAAQLYGVPPRTSKASTTMKEVLLTDSTSIVCC
jgi:hypothetical protein